MANESAAKKRILVVGTDELNYVLESINRGLKNYQLMGSPSVFGSVEKILETQLRKAIITVFWLTNCLLSFYRK